MDKLNDVQLVKMQKQIREANQQKYLEACRKRLDTIISTKIKTTFIGSIDVFEKVFGFLWGQGKNVEELSKDELKFYQLFQKARTDILNLGNTQLRGAKTEIANQTISWNRYHTEFKVIGKQEN
jgi:hypothetical protein